MRRLMDEEEGWMEKRMKWMVTDSLTSARE